MHKTMDAHCQRVAEHSAHQLLLHGRPPPPGPRRSCPGAATLPGGLTGQAASASSLWRPALRIPSAIYSRATDTGAMQKYCCVSKRQRVFKRLLKLAVTTVQ